MNIKELTNSADTLIRLEVAGNHLVRVLNYVTHNMYQNGQLRLNGDEVVAQSPSYEELHEIVERIRDQLSEQRCADTKRHHG